jgi:uncharacterized protein (TIGR00251 family)
MKVEIRSTPEGVSLAVRAQPGAKKDRINGIHDGALKVAVSAPPEDGRANQALIKLLSKTFGCKSSQVVLIQGRTDRRKVFEFLGLNTDNLVQVLERILREPDDKSD